MKSSWGSRSVTVGVVVQRAVRRAADGLLSRGDDVTDDQLVIWRRENQKRGEKQKIMKRGETERMEKGWRRKRNEAEEKWRWR